MKPAPLLDHGRTATGEAACQNRRPEGEHGGPHPDTTAAGAPRKHWYDIAHEKLRTVNGPPTLQFCDINLRAYAVQERARELDRRGRELLGEPSLPMRIVSKAVEAIALARAERQDSLEREPVVSDPGVRVSRYDGSGRAPVRSGNFGRADLARREAALWPAVPRRVRLDETTKLRVEHEEPREEAVEAGVKKKRLAVVD